MEFNFSNPVTNGNENVYHGAEGVFANQAAAQNAASNVPLGGIFLQGNTGATISVTGNPRG